MKNRYSFSDAQKVITGMPVALDLGGPQTKVLVQELGFNEQSCEEKSCTACVSPEKL